MSLAVALATSAMFAPPARADDVAQRPAGQRIESLVAGPDGGAWVRDQARATSYAIGRAGADGGVPHDRGRARRSTAPRRSGPDGQAWFDERLRRLVRVDADRHRHPASRPFDDFARGDRRPARTARCGRRPRDDAADRARDAAGRRRPRPLRVADVPDRAVLHGRSQRAADGAMWIADIGCGAGAARRAGRRRAERSISASRSHRHALAADPTGGMWFTRALGADRRARRRRPGRSRARALAERRGSRDRCRVAPGRQRVVRVRALRAGPR